MAFDAARRLGKRRLPSRDAELLTGDSIALLGLVLAVAASIALCLYLTRQTTLGADEYWYFVVNKGFNVKGLLSPHNGNLIAVIRLIYATVFAVFGPDYLVFRILEVVGVSVAGVLFFVLARRRVGGLAALVLTGPLLFLGAAPDVALSPLGITHVYCVILGLAALLALEAGSRRGDVVACVLLSLSVATFSISFAFVAAAAVSVLLSENRLRRLYIFLLPLILYGAWKLGAPKYSGPGYLAPAHLALSNVRLVPSFLVKATAATTAALTGLYYPFGASSASVRLGHYGVGYVLAGVALVAIIIRAARGAMRRSIWPFVAMYLAFWCSIVMVIGINRYPNSTRYLYGGGIALLLIAAEAMRGIRWRTPALAGGLAVSAIAVGFNIAALRNDAAQQRFVSGALRAAETGMELSAGHVRNNFISPLLGALGTEINTGGGVHPYLDAVRHWGSPAYTVTELRRANAIDRGATDAVEALFTQLRLVALGARHGPCLRGVQAGHGATMLRVRPPGVVLSSASGGSVTVARFADRPFVPIGTLTPGRAFALTMPPDRAPDPWRISVPAGPFAVCAL